VLWSFALPCSAARTLAIIVLVFAATNLGGCGRRTALETPVSWDQATPLTEEGQRAMNPPRDERGRPQRAPSNPGPVPAAQSFPLDFLLR
jgi:hypothetical protein